MVVGGCCVGWKRKKLIKKLNKLQSTFDVINDVTLMSHISNESPWSEVTVQWFFCRSDHVVAPESPFNNYQKMAFARHLVWPWFYVFDRSLTSFDLKRSSFMHHQNHSGISILLRYMLSIFVHWVARKSHFLIIVQGALGRHHVVRSIKKSLYRNFRPRAFIWYMTH